MTHFKPCLRYDHSDHISWVSDRKWGLYRVHKKKLDSAWRTQHNHLKESIKRILKINNSWTALFIFQNSFNYHWLELLRTAPLPIHKVIIITIFLTLSQTSPGFYVSAVQVFWKHCGKRRNCSVTSNFSFCHSVFYPFGLLSAIFVKLKIVVCKAFEFGRVSNLSFGKGLRWYKWDLLVFCKQTPFQ